MAKAIIFLEDAEDGTVTVGADFGDKVEEDSQAHAMGMTLLESVLRAAKRYKQVEDTVPEHSVEPSRIITPEGT